MCRSGFSFAEILFAVAILGIGFIMVAAIFPVALQQTQLALEETIGTAATRNGAAYLQGTPLMTQQGLPPSIVTIRVPAAGAPPNPPTVVSFHDPRILPAVKSDDLWKSVKQNLIVSNDPRFAIVALYSRATGATFAKIIVFGVRVRGRDQFNPATDLDRNNPQKVAELEPRPIGVQLQDNPNGADYAWISVVSTAQLAAQTKLLAQLSSTTNASDNATNAAAAGAYIVISDDLVGDNTATPTQNENGRLNGKVYQLGPQVVPAAAPPNGQAGWLQFELVPGQDLTSAAENIPADPIANPNAGTLPAIGFVIGRGYSDPANPGTYGGQVEVVQRYENVVSLP